MSLFQRIKTPFSEMTDDEDAPEPRGHAVGEALRDRREELGLDLAAIGAALRIRPEFLAALEQGRARELPGPAYAIGFIRAYAQYLGLDAERVLASYKAESAEIHARPDLALPVPLGERSLPGGPILLVGLIVALCGYGTWYYLSTGDRSRPERVAAVPAELKQAATNARAPSAAASPIAGSKAAVEQPSLTSGLASPATPPASASSVASPAADRAPAAALRSGDSAAEPAGQIEIRALADCWIQVRTADQTIVFSRVLKAGETYRVPRPGLLLRTGNAGALAIAVDGKTAPAIGAVGALRRDVVLDPQALLAGTAVHG